MLVEEGTVQMLVMERLDNGLMPRIVERMKDAEELTQERAKNVEDSEII